MEKRHQLPQKRLQDVHSCSLLTFYIKLVVNFYLRLLIPKAGHIRSDTARLSALFRHHLSVRYRGVNRRLDST
jgi:hypothetical protein